MSDQPAWHDADKQPKWACWGSDMRHFCIAVNMFFGQVLTTRLNKRALAGALSQTNCRRTNGASAAKPPKQRFKMRVNDSEMIDSRCLSLYSISRSHVIIYILYQYISTLHTWYLKKISLKRGPQGEWVRARARQKGLKIEAILARARTPFTPRTPFKGNCAFSSFSNYASASQRIVFFQSFLVFTTTISGRPNQSLRTANLKLAWNSETEIHIDTISENTGNFHWGKVCMGASSVSPSSPSKVTWQFAATEPQVHW